MADEHETAGGMRREAFDSVWDALEDTPEAAVAMRLRSDLMIAVQEEMRGWGLTQMAAAGRLGVTQPRLSDLMRGKVDRFSLDALVELAGRAGLVVRVEVNRAASKGRRGRRSAPKVPAARGGPVKASRRPPQGAEDKP